MSHTAGAQGFTAVLRWGAVDAPEWEVETHHGGFETAEEACRFANSTPAGPESLRVTDEGSVIELSDGENEPLGPYTLWKVSEHALGAGVAFDDDFDQVDVSLEEAGLEKLTFRPRAWLVEGPQGAVDLEVELDDRFGVLGGVGIREVGSVEELQAADESYAIAGD